MTKTKLFILLGVFSEIIYISLFFLNKWRHLSGDTGLVSVNPLMYFLVCALLSLSFIAYVFLSRLDMSDKNFKLGIIFFLVFSITIFFIPPLTSIDTYTYIHTSRVFSVHHANPYTYAYDTFSNDAFANQIKNIWSNKPTPYAPVFTIISSIISFIGQKSFYLSLYLFKFAFVFFNIVNCFLIFKITKSKQATILYAWNPLILFEFGVNAHNDVLTVFFLLLCLYFILKENFNLKNYYLALSFLLCSVLIKFITAFFLPIFFIIAFKQLNNCKEKIKLFIYSFLISLAIIFIAYFPFWQGLDTFTRVLFHANHIYHAWIFSSPLIVLFIILFGMMGFSNFAQIGTLAGKFIFTIAYPLLILSLIRKKNINIKNDLIKYFLISICLFFGSFFTWFMPWYLTLLLTILVLFFAENEKKYYTWVINGITLYGILYYIFLR